VSKLVKGVQLPKQIKDSWRSGIANSLVQFSYYTLSFSVYLMKLKLVFFFLAFSQFAVGSLLNAHAGIQTEFAGILKGLHSSAKVADYFRSQVNPVSRAQAVTGLLESAGASPLFVALCSKALAQGYLRDLEAINDHYLELLSMGNKEVKGVVVSADKLEADEQEKVRAALAKTLPGQKLVLDFKVDESVLGGLSVQVGTNYADLTLRKRLNVLVDRQAGSGGELQPLVKPSTETPAAWAWAAEDVAAQPAKL
jgi:F-type H+-transporting ATPase subunit delta